jgi:hypothetical protein
VREKHRSTHNVVKEQIKHTDMEKRSTENDSSKLPTAELPGVKCLAAPSLTRAMMPVKNSHNGTSSNCEGVKNT